MPAFAFRRSATTYYLVRAFDARELDADPRARRVDARQAARLVDAFSRSSEGAAERLAAYLLGESGSFAVQLGAEERAALRDQLQTELGSVEGGRWLLFARERPVNGYLGELAKLSDAQQPDQTFAWIEFDVLDQRDRPVVGVPWELLRGSEKVRNGRLNAQGNAYADGIDPGSYKIVIPEADLLEPIESGGWLGLELVDESGAPRAAEPYQVVDASGALHEGVLDAGGRAMLHGLPPGDCKVTFTQLGACDLATADAPAEA